jgi:hypothetical protein
MKRAIAIFISVCLVSLIGACSANPPKPVLPDGLHRVPVNRVLPVLPEPSANEAD